MPSLLGFELAAKWLLLSGVVFGISNTSADAKAWKLQLHSNSVFNGIQEILEFGKTYMKDLDWRQDDDRKD